jgi:peptide/nickel transport system substrate-binding protein
MRGFRCITLLFVIAFAFSACGATATPSPSGSGTTTGQSSSVPASAAGSVPPAAVSGKLSWAYQFGPRANWALETDDSYVLMQAGVAEPLTKSDFDGTLKPNLAESWKRVDPLTWDFTLRAGVKFQDGTPLTAKAVADDLNHVLNAEVPARAFNKTVFDSVEAVNDTTVRVKTKAPDILVPDRMASNAAVILGPNAFSASGINPVGTGTGPFAISSMNLPQSISLKANPNYWGGAAKIADVDVLFTADPQTRATLLASGDAQLSDNIPIAVLPTIKSTPGVKVESLDLQRIVTLHLNNSRPPFNNPKFRQAVQLAIDVNAIANQALEGGATPASGPFAPTEPWAPKGATVIAQNVDQAKALLAEVGYDPKSPALSIWAYVERPELPVVATAIQAMLQNVGINTEVRVAQYGSLEGDVLAGKFDMFAASRGYTFDVNDPGSFFLSDYSCDGTYNLGKHCDAAFDAAAKAAGQLEDPTARYAAYAALATQLQASAEDVFLYYEKQFQGVSDKLQGYRIHPRTQYALTIDMSLSN